MRTTYNQLTSPIAQLEAARDFVGQMESVVGDEWSESEEAEELANHEAAHEFLEELREEGFHHEVLTALKKLGLRFEIDGEDEGEGYFQMRCKNWPQDLVLHRLARAFSGEVCKFAPKGWGWSETARSLAWENLVVVPDGEKSVVRAIKLTDGYVDDFGDADLEDE